MADTNNMNVHSFKTSWFEYVLILLWYVQHGYTIDRTHQGTTICDRHLL